MLIKLESLWFAHGFAVDFIYVLMMCDDGALWAARCVPGRSENSERKGNGPN